MNDKSTVYLPRHYTAKNLEALQTLTFLWLISEFYTSFIPYKTRKNETN